MDHSKNNKGSDPSGAYGYGAGYAGYSAVGYGGESTAHRTFQDYMLILRERIWYVVVVFLVVFSSVLVYTLGQTKVYESVATVQILRRDLQVLGPQVEGVTPSGILGAEDLNTQVKILESAKLIQDVASRLSADEVRRLMEPYETGRASDPKTPEEVIFDNREIVPQRLSLIVAVTFRHPDKVLAAKIANLFAHEYMNYSARVRIDDAMLAIGELEPRVKQQTKRVEDLELALQRYREENNLVSLDDQYNIVTTKLQQLNQYLTQCTAVRKDAENKWKQVEERRSEGGNLTELSFISQQPAIAALMQSLTEKKIIVAQLRERYRERHPTMIEALNSLGQTERELDRAVASAAAAIEAEYSTARRNEDAAALELAAQEKKTLELTRAAVEFKNRERELAVQEAMLQQLIARAGEINNDGTLENKNARIVDTAKEAIKPASPNVPLNIAIGLVGGAGLGLAFAFFVAFIDDRVKSSFDIEAVVGLQLIGVIPQIKRMEQPEKAQIVANNADRQVAEAFLALHSTLRLKDESKNAKCMLVTSTIPGEGKSFTTTNLALTFAAHGERTVIVDCDLRKPNVHKSFRLENLKGVIDVCTGNATVDDVVIKNIHPNLDVIPAGGRAKNPTQILNSKGLEVLLSDLRKRYDRVFIDTPPLAAVSDALIVLPLVDGSIFTILFNRVRRKAVQFAARKLLEANVPNLGAVLNGLNLAVSGYYYAQYYDKSYKDYYVVGARDENPTADQN